MRKFYIKKTGLTLLTFFLIIVVFKIYIQKYYDVIDQSNVFLIQGFFKTILLFASLYLILKSKIFQIRYVFVNNIISFLIIILLVYLSINHTNNIQTEKKIFITDYLHFTYFFQNLSTGFFEEFFFRILIFGYVIKILKTSEKTKYNKEILLTSLLFGIVHVSNIFNTDYDFFSVIFQILFAFLIGVLLQSLFLKTGNIFLISVIHGLFNYHGMLKSKLFNVISTQNTDIYGDIIQTFLFLFIFGIIVVFPIFLLTIKNLNNQNVKFVENNN